MSSTINKKVNHRSILEPVNKENNKLINNNLLLTKKINNNKVDKNNDRNLIEEKLDNIDVNNDDKQNDVNNCITTTTTTTTTTITAITSVITTTTSTTMPYKQPIKFSMEKIDKNSLIDTNLILQNIKSAEVLRTCQNVSNVLLQIPKYQEKLLNFSTNELNECNNIKNSSNKCETAVLNVPDPSKVLNNFNNNNTFNDYFDDSGLSLLDEATNDLTSTLDLAEIRRKRKREFNENNACSSESDDEDELKNVDLWITKGPPAKKFYSEKKVSFLAMFGLTTHTTKNEIEIEKLEKRYRLNPESPDIPVKNFEIPIKSSLPIPTEHPDYLIPDYDFVPKIKFLSEMGLNYVTSDQRDKAEKNWQFILEQRKKRMNINSVTLFCDRMANAYSINPIKKLPDGFVQYHMNPIKHKIERYTRAKRVRKQKIIKNPDDCEDDDKDKIKWTNIENIMTAYNEYSKEKSMEKELLKTIMTQSIARINELHSKADELEREKCELKKTKRQLKNEERYINVKIEKIMHLIDIVVDDDDYQM